MTVEVFRDQLKKRGFDDTQVQELEECAVMMRDMDGMPINKAYNAIFDTAIKTLAQLLFEKQIKQFENFENEIINGTGNIEPRGIMP